jgi:hypothetical protein
LAISGFGPVERGTTLAFIESFKRGHLQARLVAIVVGELYKWKAIFPFGSVR